MSRTFYLFEKVRSLPFKKLEENVLGGYKEQKQ